MTSRLPEPQYQRYPMQVPFLYRVQGPAPVRKGVGWTRNLSERGMCAELAEVFQPHTALHVLLQTDRDSIGLEAVVIWVEEPGPGGRGTLHGLVFQQTTQEQAHALRDLLGSGGGVVRHSGVRLSSEIPVTCRRKGETGPPIHGRTGDVSRTGLLLRLPETFPPGTAFEVSLRIADEPLTAEGTIVWVEPPELRSPGGLIRHGFRFTALGWTSLLALAPILAVLP